MRAEGGRESKQAKEKANNEAPFEAWTYRVSFNEVDASSLAGSRGYVEQYAGLLNESGVVHIKEGFSDLAREVHLARWIVDNEVNVLCAT
jgi:hypothetical protein